MEKIQKLYLSLLSKILLKSLLRAFLMLKLNSVKYFKPAQLKKEEKKTGNKKGANHGDRYAKVQSLTEASFKSLIEEPKDIFEELKSSLQNKLLQGEFTPVKALETIKSPKMIHNKNALSFTTAYLNKGTRKFLVRSPTVITDEIAVVSSSSLANLKAKKKLNIFSYT